MNILIYTFLITCLAFFCIWAISVKMKDVGIVDFYWGPGFAITAWFAMVFTPATQNMTVLYAQYTFVILVTLWAIRIAFQIIARHQNATKEDGRYLKMRKKGGEQFWISSLYKIFMPQAIIHWLISVTILGAIIYAPITDPALDYSFSLAALIIGSLIFLFGFIYESVADWQLYKAKQNLELNKTYKGGLWFYSRHPNYFGEILVWIGLAIFAYAICGHPIVFLGPIFLSLAICFISQPITQKHLLESRQDYRDYLEVTPRIAPNFLSSIIASRSGSQKIKSKTKI